MIDNSHMMIATREWTTIERISPAYAPFVTTWRVEIWQDSATRFSYRKTRNGQTVNSFSDGLKYLDAFMERFNAV